MHSQLGNAFFRMEVLDDEIDIYTNTTTAKSSILSKRNQHKKVRWEESVVDNEYKHTIRKATYLKELSRKFAKLQATIVNQEDLINSQVGEITRLKGLQAQAHKEEIPEGFELYATTFGTAKEPNTAIQNRLWDILIELAPKLCNSEMNLAAIKDKANKYEKRIRIVTSSMTPGTLLATSSEGSYAPAHSEPTARNIETKQLSVSIFTNASRHQPPCINLAEKTLIGL